MQNQKPWKSYQAQLNILKARGLKVGDEAKALHYLERIGYYRLSGYWYPFRENDPVQARQKTNQFKADSYFEDAVKLYVFDKRLRLLALDALERIELALRVDVSHLLGKTDVCGHENPNLFHGGFSKHVDKKSRMTAHQQWLKSFDRKVSRARKEPFIEHYQKKYKGQLPIWVACEVWDFGGLSHLFAGLKLSDQQMIADKYGVLAKNSTDPRHTPLMQWIRSLNFIRNVSAHHSRLWNISMMEMSAPIPLDYWQDINSERCFFYFCVMQQMLKTICPNSTWGKRVLSLIKEMPIPRNSSVSWQGMGILKPNDLEKWDLWQ